ncbi:hypothetical protein RA11412_0200 [Rothia aeria]|uniref:Uncharacterized protein n=1 Tax=Rothia aeria TaxID=172042 RepID=A0A2Z5R0U9_9MICC|nr:hypothetical protein RA11412_0200 [Rothia aeria]
MGVYSGSAVGGVNSPAGAPVTASPAGWATGCAAGGTVVAGASTCGAYTRPAELPPPVQGSALAAEPGLVRVPAPVGELELVRVPAPVRESAGPGA